MWKEKKKQTKSCQPLRRCGLGTVLGGQRKHFSLSRVGLLFALKDDEGFLHAAFLGKTENGRTSSSEVIWARTVSTKSTGTWGNVYTATGGFGGWEAGTSGWGNCQETSRQVSMTLHSLMDKSQEKQYWANGLLFTWHLYNKMKYVNRYRILCLYCKDPLPLNSCKRLCPFLILAFYSLNDREARTKPLLHWISGDLVSSSSIHSFVSDGPTLIVTSHAKGNHNETRLIWINRIHERVDSPNPHLFSGLNLGQFTMLINKMLAKVCQGRIFKKSLLWIEVGETSSIMENKKSR